MLNPDKCKKRVYHNSFYGRQCYRKAVKDGWCFQHHPDTVKKHREESDRKYQESLKKNPWYLLKEANKRIEELEAEVSMLKERIGEK